MPAAWAPDRPASPTPTLDEIEIAGLVFMRQEEKLAHDLYLQLYQLWGLPVFQRIASSEAQHTAAIQRLLARFSIEDPVMDLAVGEFIDPELQRLYTELLAEGSQSIEGALRVAARVEEVDILDLQERLAQTDEGTIQSVYTRLLQGSQNHLRAFASQYESAAGERYTPQWIDQAVLEQILRTQRGAERGETGRGGGRFH